MRTKHRLSKLDLLGYAHDGAVTQRGINSGSMSDEEADDLDRDIAEIERRIKLIEIANAQKQET